MSVMHTRGPWNTNNQGYILDQHGQYVPIISPFIVDAYEGDPEAIANSRLIASAPDFLNFIEDAGGKDGFLLSQVATFIGALADCYGLTGTARQQAEEYYEKLHELSEQRLNIIDNINKDKG